MSKVQNAGMLAAGAVAGLLNSAPAAQAGDWTARLEQSAKHAPVAKVPTMEMTTAQYNRCAEISSMATHHRKIFDAFMTDLYKNDPQAKTFDSQCVWALSKMAIFQTAKGGTYANGGKDVAFNVVVKDPEQPAAPVVARKISVPHWMVTFDGTIGGAGKDASDGVSSATTSQLGVTTSLSATACVFVTKDICLGGRVGGRFIRNMQLKDNAGNVYGNDMNLGEVDVTATFMTPQLGLVDQVTIGGGLVGGNATVPFGGTDYKYNEKGYNVFAKGSKDIGNGVAVFLQGEHYGLTSTETVTGKENSADVNIIEGGLSFHTN